MAITRPVTRTIISSPSWGIPITDEVNRLTDEVAAMTPTAWVAVTFQNGWSNYSGYATQYRKVRDMVQVRGGAANGAVGTTVFVLPTGFRPPNVLQFPVASWATVGVVQIDPSGVVFCQTSVDPRFAGMAFTFSNQA